MERADRIGSVGVSRIRGDFGRWDESAWQSFLPGGVFFIAGNFFFFFCEMMCHFICI